MGASPMHSSTVGLIRNLQTGSITPQFHVVYDDFFETVHNDENEEPEEWEDLVIYNSFRNDFDDPQAAPELNEEWLSPEEAYDRKRRELERKEAQRPPEQKASEGDRRSRDDRTKADLPRQSADDTRQVRFEDYEPAPPPMPEPASPPRSPAAAEASPPRPTPPIATMPETTGPRRSQRTTKGKMPSRFQDYQVNVAEAKEVYKSLIAGISQAKRSQVIDYRYAIALLTDAQSGTIDMLPPDIARQPLALKSKKQDDPDLPSYRDAMAGEHREQFQEAMTAEIEQLEEHKTWNVMKKSAVPKGANVLPTTWVLRVKRYPDGRFRKFKARLCVRGDRQVEGVDYFEKYSPVVQWSTVRMMLSLTASQDLKTRQVDFSNAFVQATLNEDVYISLPQGYEAEGADEQMVLKLNKSLYGLVQAPLYWGLHLKAALEDAGFEPSSHDPCLYTNSEGVVVLTYVDDCLFFAKDNSKIDAVIAKLGKKLKMTIEGSNEDTVYAFLGVDVMTDKERGTITLRQTGLIDKILKTCNMENCNTKATPCNVEPLGTDANGKRCEAEWDYASVVGMLMYLCSNSRPDIQFAVHQCARFTHSPRASHEQAILRICRYLKGTREQGMTFKPDPSMQLNCYVDADFAGLWSVEDDQDPVCVKSRTGYVLTLGNCPLLWVSKLQTEIALSTTEAEYIAMSQAMRDLLPMRSLLQHLGDKMKLSFSKPTIIHSKVFEDNNGALTLATAPKISPRTKHIAVKYHFFREHVGKEKGIEILKIDTNEQLADAFTKGLSAEKFQGLRKRLLGW